MDTPQEIEVWFILPALRRQLALSLKKEGLKQRDIALVLNLTEPAVSQYLKNKRGYELSFPSEIIQEIEWTAKIIAADRRRTMLEMQKMFKKIKETRFICNVCRTHLKTTDDCEICYV